MKKILVLMVISVLFLSTIHDVGSPEGVPPLLTNTTLSPEIQSSTSSVSGGGSSQTATMFFDRTIADQQLHIFNTYGDTATHRAELNLSTYQVSGWRLSDVQIDVESINASSEKEVVGVTYESFDFSIYEFGVIFYEQLAQGFYNQSHDGALVNYSIYYNTDDYDPPKRGNASIVVRSGSSGNLDGAVDITTPINLTASDSAFSWLSVQGGNATLSANTVYWTVIDGSNLIKAGSPFPSYPTIYWGAENDGGTFDSYQRGSASWLYMPLEALMNYTYIPWNQTANAPLIYSTPQQVDLRGNSTAITSSNFNFSSATKNITSISFDTNQSIYFNCNITLSYIKDTVVDAAWAVNSSGSLVDWSVVVSTSYPSVTGQVLKYLNISKANSWTITGLYESAAPTTNHTDYTLIGTTVRCGSMTDGTWSLAANSHNHLSALHTYDSSDDRELISLTSILVDIDVNLTILEQDSDPVSTGLANLTIVKGGSIVWSPTNKSVSSGEANYLWNIDSTSSDNGAFTLEVSWANGTDAGYLVKELVVYYPTDLTASESDIDAYTESTFEVRVYFEDTFTPQGLYGAPVNVVYSFDSGSNVSTGITDHNNGTWSALIPTTGKDPGTYLVDIYAEGYALQNQSVQVSVNLIHDTETLTFLWSNTNDITYVETTELSVYYNRVTGSTPIPDALVNVTIDTKTWTLVWDEVSAYKITFNGTDVPPGIGLHSLRIEAWKDGHRVQVNNTQTLNIQEEPTTMVYEWSNENDITYIESTKLSVNYTMSDGSPVLGATVNVTINLVPYDLVWNGTSETYDYVFDGSAPLPGRGVHSLTINADLFGYEDRSATSVPLTISEEPTSLVITWSAGNNISYVEETYMIANYTMSNGSAVVGAFVNVTIGSVERTLEWNSTSKLYTLSISGNDPEIGLGTHSVVVQATLFGYEQKTNNTQVLTINKGATDLVIIWSNGNNLGYFEYSDLFVNYRMTSNFSTIRNAELNVTIDSGFWLMQWNETAGMYQVRFNGSDWSPGVGFHDLEIRADKFGYVSQADFTQNLTLPVIPTNIQITWSNTDTITFLGHTILSVEYTMYDDTVIQGATVNITIDLKMWTLNWNGSSGAYEITFNGTDSPPGLGIHSTSIKAWKEDFEGHVEITEVLTINEESTILVISWSNSDNISYVRGTTLSVSYQMTNTTPIVEAAVNATIGGLFRILVWNPGNEAYEAYFAGDEDPPGYHTHTVEIRANKHGYEYIFNNSQELTITEEETSISFEWNPSSTITYVEYTKIRIFYRMSNDTDILGATVNVTIGDDRWDADWNETSQAYEISWLGTADPPGLDSHTLIIRTWKANYVGITNVSQTLIINEEPTQIDVSWTNGNSITYSNSTTLLVNFTSSNGTVIPSALVNVTIGVDTWVLDWNSTSQLYEITFNNESVAWPGLGTFGLTIRGWQFGYELTVNATQTLLINSEQVLISSELLNGSTITYIGDTIFAVNYTTTDGTPISGAIVNVTISGHLWNLTWHAISETYRIQFNGSDTLPGFGIHNLIVNASSYGFDGLTDSSQFLTIIEEPTTLTAYWSAPNYDSVTYFDHTILYVNYQMSNGSDISSASVNVIIDLKTWTLDWNSTAAAYTLRFNGSDSPPGFGTHTLLIEAGFYGFADASNSSQSLTLAKDPTTIEVSWINSNNITYVEYTVLSVIYKMSNGTDILGATVNATIGTDPWVLLWNETTGAYQIRFDGNQIPPGFGTFTADIHASAAVYVAQNPSTTLTVRTESTTVISSWSSVTIDWTESVILSFDFRDSYGHLIEDATTKSVHVDSVEYGLLGTNGTYWIEFDNSFNLGLHSVWANFSKLGYDQATLLSIDFTINEAQTDLTIGWSSTVIDYLGQIDLTMDYYYVGTGTSVPSAGVVANITIDGATTVSLTLQGNLWVANLTGIFLDLGSHTIDIRAQVYGYEYSESLGIILNVNEVATDVLVVTWTPSNLTIEYTSSFILNVDYTFYGGDVPAISTVNVSIEGLFYDLTYSTGIWSVSIPGDELRIGVRTATISAWLYGYQLQTDVTVGLNVTVAANMFMATWEPLDLQATYIDTVNLSVVYTEDWVPILGATVELTINGTLYTLTYSAVDEMWHFSMEASTIGLGVWNVTVTANKTGYADSWDSRLLTISLTPTNLTVIRSSTTIYYDESITLEIFYQLMNSNTVPGATCIVTLNSIVQSTLWDTDHWVVTLSGTAMGLGIHSIVVNVDAFGFEPATNSFDVTVIAIPTSVTVNDVSFTVYPFDSVTVSFTWIDDLKATGIAGYEPDVTWSDTYSIVDCGNGTYSIELGNNATHVGIYNLNVTFTRIGYVIGFRMVIVEIVELPIVLTFNDRIDQFENETITISIQMYDVHHAALVDWGEIVIELSGVQYSLVYDNSSQAYTTDIWLSDLEPGVFTLNFTATATDCEIKYGEIHLDIVPKIRYTIILEVDDEVQAGQTVHISVLMTYESGAVPGFYTIVHILIERGESGTHKISEQVIGTDGLAELDFLVPSDATRLTIWVDFDAGIGEWPAISNIVIRDVTPMAIISLLDPITLTIVVGGGGGSLVGLILLRRRRVRGRGVISSPSVVDSIIAPTSVPSAPVGEMDMMKENIRGSPDGLTRAQIAQSLEISTSKAGVLVKNLLDADATFEEVREGRFRRIRFRSEE